MTSSSIPTTRINHEDVQNHTHIAYRSWKRDKRVNITIKYMQSIVLAGSVRFLKFQIKSCQFMGEGVTCNNSLRSSVIEINMNNIGFKLYYVP